jgi:hypothetical protein
MRCVRTGNCALYTETEGHIGIILLNRLGKITRLTEQLAKSEVLTGVVVKITVFWDVTPCILVAKLYDLTSQKTEERSRMRRNRGTHFLMTLTASSHGNSCIVSSASLVLESPVAIGALQNVFARPVGPSEWRTARYNVPDFRGQDEKTLRIIGVPNRIRIRTRSAQRRPALGQ